MPFVVNTPKGQVHLMDLPFEELERIEKLCDVQWTQVVVAPAQSASCALATYRVACEWMDAEPDVLTARKLIGEPKIFEMVEDGDPDDIVYQGGVPKSEDAPATTGSSGAPSSSDGHPMSPDDSPSGT